jgi:hypothetical protein
MVAWGSWGVQSATEGHTNEAHMVAWGSWGVQSAKDGHTNEAQRIGMGEITGFKIKNLPDLVDS